MKAVYLITILAATGTMAVVSSPASALVCSSPAAGFFDDLIGQTQREVYVPCNSFNAGTSRIAKAHVYRQAASKTFSVTLIQGDRALAHGYNSSGQFITGCVVEDFVLPQPRRPTRLSK